MEVELSKVECQPMQYMGMLHPQWQIASMWIGMEESSIKQLQITINNK
jgi:hypothetical protein